MIISSPQSQFVTKIIFSPTGQQFRATFLVTIVDGRARGRLISVEAVSAGKLQGKVSEATSHATLCLPLSIKKEIVESLDVNFGHLVSPFASDFAFFMSQPTRAPSFE